METTPVADGDIRILVAFIDDTGVRVATRQAVGDGAVEGEKIAIDSFDSEVEDSAVATCEVLARLDF